MLHFDHLLRALMISIPIGIAFGLTAGFLRKRLGEAISEKHPSAWEILRRVIFAIGIFMFGVLSYYCFHVVLQTGFGQIYLAMSVLNGICLIRAFSTAKYDEYGVHAKNQRVARRVMPTVR